MRPSPLLQIYFVYHEADAADIAPYESALVRAFHYIQPDRAASDLDMIPDVWERVQFRPIPNGPAWSAAGRADAQAGLTTEQYIDLLATPNIERAMAWEMSGVSNLILRRTQMR